MVGTGVYAIRVGLFGCAVSLICYGLTLGSSSDLGTVTQAYMVGVFQGVSLAFIIAGMILKRAFSTWASPP